MLMDTLENGGRAVMILKCEVHKNIMCAQSCGCCGHCDLKYTCNYLCGIYRENKGKFSEVENGQAEGFTK